MKRLILFLTWVWGVSAGVQAQEAADSVAAADVAAAEVPPAPEADAPASEATPDALWDRANTAYINGG